MGYNAANTCAQDNIWCETQNTSPSCVVFGLAACYTILGETSKITELPELEWKLSSVHYHFRQASFQNFVITGAGKQLYLGSLTIVLHLTMKIQRYEIYS